MRLTPEELASRKRRNLWLALALVAFMVAVFMTTFMRMQHNSSMANKARAAALATQGAPLIGVAP